MQSIGESEKFFVSLKVHRSINKSNQNRTELRELIQHF